MQRRARGAGGVGRGVARLVRVRRFKAGLDIAERAGVRHVWGSRCNAV